MLEDVLGGRLAGLEQGGQVALRGVEQDDAAHERPRPRPREARGLLRFLQEIQRPRGDDDQHRLAQHHRREDIQELGQAALAGRAEDRELLQQFMEELHGGRTMPDAGCRAGPAQDQTPPLVSAGLQADGRRERDRLLDGLALLGRRLGPRQPGVDEDRQILLVLLLELLDHQFIALRRRPPVDPALTIAGSIIAKAVILHLLRGLIVPLSPTILGRLSLDQEPASGELADLRVHDDLVGERDRHAVLNDSERSPGPDVEIAESIFPSFRTATSPLDPFPLATGYPREENPR